MPSMCTHQVSCLRDISPGSAHEATYWKSDLSHVSSENEALKLSLGGLKVLVFAGVWNELQCYMHN